MGLKVFDYNPTEIDPGQSFVIRYEESFIIKGRNFNVSYPYSHRVFVGGQAFGLYAVAIDSETLVVRFGKSSLLLGRISDFKLETMGQISQNSVRLELAHPDIPILKKSILSISLSNYLTYGNMTGIEGNGYALGNKEIFKIDVLRKTMEILRALKLGTHSLHFTFPQLMARTGTLESFP